MQQWARFAILGAMFVVAYLLILAWQKDYGHAETRPQQEAAVVSHEVSADLPNGQTATAASDMPQANIATQQTTTDATAPVSQQLISVQTDLYHLWINPKGGDIVRIELLNHDKNKDSDQPFVMLESDAKRTYVAQSGLIGLNGPDSNRNGRPVYEIEKSSYNLADAKAEKTEDGKVVKVLSVPMVYKTADGVEIIKTFTFKQGEYPIIVNHKIVNRSAGNWQGQMFGQIKRDNSDDPGKSDQGIFTLGTFLGGAWGTPEEHYNKLKFANFNEEKLNVEAKGGWVAMVQHYFVSAWIPGDLKLTQAGGQPYSAKLESRQSTDNMNIIGFTSPMINVPAGTAEASTPMEAIDMAQQVEKGIENTIGTRIQGLSAETYAAHPDWTEDFLTVNEYSRPGDPLTEVNNIFVHYTANPGTSAAQNRSYFEQLKDNHERSASAHFIIGYNGEILQCVPLDEIAYAVQTRNEDSISIECCYKADNGQFTQETYDSLIRLLRWLIDAYELEPEDILRHYDCGGKKCPIYYTEHEDAWDRLKEDVKNL